MNNPVLSVIVPIYNVEPYLRNCIDSILNQPFTDLELILVEDESPDNSGQICDEYAEKDSRVRVIHKKNGGLSSARNAGLDSMRGQYISFIDSDDKIAEDTYQINIQYLLANPGVDILQYPMYLFYEGPDASLRVIAEQTFVGKEEIMRNWWSGDILSGSVCNKIFKASVFKDIRFPQGKTSEDWYMVTDLLKNIEQAYISEMGCYFYYHRMNSITTSVSLNKLLDHYASHFRNYVTLFSFKGLRKYRLPAFMRLYGRLLTAKIEFPEFDPTGHIAEIRKVIPTIGDILQSSVALKEKLKVIFIKLFSVSLHLRFTAWRLKKK